jgi:hypothetical protein
LGLPRRSSQGPSLRRITQTICGHRTTSGYYASCGCLGCQRQKSALKWGGLKAELSEKRGGSDCLGGRRRLEWVAQNPNRPCKRLLLWLPASAVRRFRNPGLCRLQLRSRNHVFRTSLRCRRSRQLGKPSVNFRCGGITYVPLSVRASHGYAVSPQFWADHGARNAGALFTRRRHKKNRSML